MSFVDELKKDNLPVHFVEEAVIAEIIEKTKQETKQFILDEQHFTAGGKLRINRTANCAFCYLQASPKKEFFIPQWLYEDSLIKYRIDLRNILRWDKNFKPGYNILRGKKDFFDFPYFTQHLLTELKNLGFYDINIYISFYHGYPKDRRISQRTTFDISSFSSDRENTLNKIKKIYADKNYAGFYITFQVKWKGEPVSTEKQNEGCYIATSVYGSYNCPQVMTLRKFRDSTLAKTWYGRCFIKSYYTISPMLVKLFGNTKWFQRFWKNRLDKMVQILDNKNIEKPYYKDK